VLVGLLLPEFLPSLPAFLVLLPGILAITIAKTLSSYISGLAMPQLVGGAAVVGLSVNVVFNIVLIPEFGILGAAASSTVSYTVHMVVLLVIATRLAGRPAASFLVPRRMDIERLRSGLLTLLPRRPANP
jgi:O-antigen/teichoic acid export membrane protein